MRSLLFTFTVVLALGRASGTAVWFGVSSAQIADLFLNTLHSIIGPWKSSWTARCALSLAEGDAANTPCWRHRICAFRESCVSPA